MAGYATGGGDPFGVRAWLTEVAPAIRDLCMGYQITDAGKTFSKGHPLTIRLTLLVPADVFGPENRERREHGS